MKTEIGNVIIQLSGALRRQASDTEILQLLFDVLAECLPIHRLVLTTRSGPAEVIDIGPDHVATPRIERQSPIPIEYFDRAVAEKFVLASDTQLHSVEILVAVPRSGGRQKLLAVGLTEPDVNQSDYRDLLTVAVELLALSPVIRQAEMMPADLVPGADGDVTSRTAGDRVEIVRLLADGFFHEITSRLSTISGQADIIHMQLGHLPKTQLLEPLERGIGKLNLPRFSGHIEKIEYYSIRRCVYVEEASSV